MTPVALIAPDLRRAARTARRLSGTRGHLAPYSLESFLRSRRRVRGVVIDPGAASPAQAAAFIARVRRRLFFPPPGARLGAAISGLRDEPGESPTRRARGAGTSGLLLEGALTAPRARRAIRRAELSRDWIVEDPRRIRLSEGEIEELAGNGVRWFALAPLDLVAIVGPPRLRRRLEAAGAVIPRGTPFWSPPARGRTP
jgi:hypothetical protein